MSTQGASMRLQWVDARSLLTHRRLDYIIKWRFFRHLIDGGWPQAEETYRWHIWHRTCGNEPNSPKATVEDYVVACSALVASLEDKGFDPAHAVRIGSNGLIVGTGAHRIACCIALDTPIAIHRVDRLPKPPLWHRGWMMAKGMAGADVAGIEADLEMLKGSWSDD